MQENSNISLREALEAMPTPQLDEMLHAELKKEPADPDLVRKILDVLDAREADDQEPLDAQAEQVWEQYQKRIAAMKPKRRQAISRRWKWLLTTAAGLVLVAAVVLPQRVEAESIWDMLVRWKQDILEFINPDTSATKYEYTFQTENEAMQQIYDAAVELGIEKPLVPMWFDDFGLQELRIDNSPAAETITAVLQNSRNRAVLQIDIFTESILRGYCGDEESFETYEKEGTFYRVTKNLEMWAVVWTKDNIEYFLTIDCQEEILREILASIYAMEE